MTVLRIKTSREEFEAGEDGGYVYGEIRRQTTFPVYVELGREHEYVPSARDDPKTEYRLFRHSNVYLAQTDEQLDQREYIAQRLNETVIIYC